MTLRLALAYTALWTLLITSTVCVLQRRETPTLARTRSELVIRSAQKEQSLNTHRDSDHESSCDYRRALLYAHQVSAVVALTFKPGVDPETACSEEFASTLIKFLAPGNARLYSRDRTDELCVLHMDLDAKHVENLLPGIRCANSEGLMNNPRGCEPRY